MSDIPDPFDPSQGLGVPLRWTDAQVAASAQPPLQNMPWNPNTVGRGGNLAAPTLQSLPWDQAKQLIFKYESAGGQNIPNFRFDPTHTAQGQYQITNSTWKDWAPQVGVDLGKYPNAMSAPPEVQEQVARWGYENHGWSPWAPFNPRLTAALQGQQAAPKGGSGSLAALDPIDPEPPQSGASSLADRIRQSGLAALAVPSGGLDPQKVGQAISQSAGATSPWQRLMMLSMIQQLSGQGTHKFVQIEYDPWKYVPQLTGGGRLASIGGRSV